MQYKSLLSAVLVGLAFTGEVSAQRGDRRGGFRGAKSSSVAVAATSTAAQATGAASVASGNRGAGNTGNTGKASNNGGNNNNNNGGNNGGNNNGGNNNADVLNPAAVQTGSQQDGQQASGAVSGQAASATDAANFINFCAGKTLTNGLQIKGGSCNGIVMGDIPANTKMVSTVITFPQNNQDIAANQTFNLQASTINMQFGSFTNAQATYYAAPQALNNQGVIIGHTHFTVQPMPDANTKTPLDPTKFDFFKGVDDAGDGKGDVKAVVTGGLAVGSYRVCTMTSSSNHQPVLMPVAQRGAQDDCVRFTVSQNGGGNNGGNNGRNNGGNNNNGNNNNGGGGGKNNGGNNAGSATTTAAAAASSASASKTGGGNRGGNKGNTGKQVVKGGSKTGNTGKVPCKKNGKREVHMQW